MITVKDRLNDTLVLKRCFASIDKPPLIWCLSTMGYHLYNICDNFDDRTIDWTGSIRSVAGL